MNPQMTDKPSKPASTKLELTWPGKQNRPRLEPRILLEDKALSYHAAPPAAADLVEQAEAGPTAFDDNLLIHGDNLLALKALESQYSGQVKCIYIDPPFNTGEAFEHYDDGVEHSQWLTLLRDRLQILHGLLSKEGSLFVHIDDNELAYLIVILDEIFGRSNRIGVMTFKQSSVSGPKAINPGVVTTCSYLVYYAKNKATWKPNRVFVPTKRDDRYSKYIEKYEQGHAQWELTGLREAYVKHMGLASWDEVKKKFADKVEAKLTEFVLANSERVVRTARVAPKDVNEDARRALNRSLETPGVVQRSSREDKDDYFFLDGEQLIFYKTKTRIINGALSTASPLSNLWDDLLSNNLHNEGGVSFPNGKKPEALLKRCIELSTNPGDIVLDSFSGSGTTGAVAHKMGRRWIMVELGDQCHTHIAPRLKSVINGKDPSGITKAVNWRGGGGFRYYRLAPSLLKKDKWGHWVINPDYNAEMLSEAMCKLMGFTYAPSQTHFWQHGQSTETDFIYVTTGSLSHDQLRVISEEVGSERSLLICCKAFMADTSAFLNLTLKKIPKTVLHKCHWDHDDYSFKIDVLADPEPLAEEEDEFELNTGDEDTSDE